MMQQDERQRVRRDLPLAIGAFLVVMVLWQVPAFSLLMIPLRLFVTTIHELGHGLAAELTGGSFLRFEVSRDGAGVAYTHGGARFVIIQAGYWGTAVFGALLLLATYHVSTPNRVATGLGVFLGIMTLGYSDIQVSRMGHFQVALVAATLIIAVYLILTRETDQGRAAGVVIGVLGGALLVRFSSDGNGLTLLTGIGSALILIGVGLRASREIATVLLTFLAILCGLQAIVDAWVLLKIVSLPASMIPFNDASAMAREFGGVAALWALWWVVVDVVIFGAAVYATFFTSTKAAIDAA